MANSYVEYTATGTGTNGLGQQTFSYAGVEVLNANDIKVFGQKIDGTKEELTIYARDASAKTVTLVQTPAAWGGGYIEKARVYRQTTADALVDGARLTESDLDTAYKQGLFVAQEISEDAAGVGTQLTNTTNVTLGGTTTAAQLKISNGSEPATPSNGGILYVQSGALKYKGSSGNVTPLASA
jgi:dipeptidyl aminopeptidase/acylaminoacyl peptidase